MPDLIHAVADQQAHADAARAAGKTLALVPTMGALHDGHLALVEEARRHADHVTVSIFVNPTQFGPDEDLDRYPRDLDGDLAKLASVGGVDAVFAPTAAEMYPTGLPAATWVDVDGLDAHLCGAHRPGHFRGVTTVVSKLFHACRPHVAVFGKKDAQQFLILRRMAADLLFGVDIVGVPIVREADGLALSSRNVYLSEGERAQAVALSQAVRAAEAAVSAGERQAEGVVEAMLHALAQAPDVRVQYAELVDTTTLQPVDALRPGQEVLAAVAAYLGGTRLIDNAFISVPGA